MRKYLINLFLLFVICISSINSKGVFGGGNIANGNRAIYQAFAKQCTPAGKSSYVGVITAGGTWAQAEKAANDIMSVLRITYGITKTVWLPFHIDNGNSCTSTSYNSIINSLTGVYFNAGNTGPIINCFIQNGQATSALALMKSRYNNGDLALFGSSAGAIVLQKPPVLQIQDSWNALVNGPRYTAQAGLGFFDQGFFDAHFSTRARMGVFARNMWDKNSFGYRGFGVDEQTAMVMDTDNSFVVRGTGGVYVFDTSSAIKGSLYTSNKNRWALRNIKVSYLTDGDTYTFSTSKVIVATNKKTFTGDTSSTAKYSSDIFSSGGFTTITTGLFRSRSSTKTYGLTTENTPQYRLSFSKKSDSKAYILGTTVSYTNMYMDIYCVSNC